MFFFKEKLKARIKELEPYRYMERTPVTGWLKKEDPTKSLKYPPEIDESWEHLKMGEYWEGRDKYLWLRAEFQVPDCRGKELVLLFDFGKTGGGHNSGFESLLFINGEPYQGVDSNHKEVFLDEQYFGKKIELALKLWSGLEGGGPQKIMRHHFKYGDCAILNPTVDDLYYTSNNMLKTVEAIDPNLPESVRLLNALERAFREIDWSYPGSEIFYQSCEKANEVLTAELSSMEKNTSVNITAIGHTHIDVAWLWRLKHTREKAARSFSTVLRLMEKYPDYVFLQTQPQLYKFIKEDYPEIFEKIKSKVKEGKWEIDGAMWLEADCNIPSGESFVRQILHGSRFIKKEFNQDIHYLWLPDVFGYSWALPQILKKSGINTFMTTKISWNQYNRMPHDTFIWRGIDGSEVLAHFITTPEPENIGTGSWFYTYNGLLEPSTVKGIYDGYRDKNINQNLLLSYGYGDGGGGVNRDMLENRRRLDKIPGLPYVKTGKAKDFFEELHETINDTDQYVHTWDGELYLEYHRGTYTSQAYVKKMNRRLEFAYREMELLQSWAYKTLPNWEYPAEKLHAGWEIILRNQFHDIIPGSSIHEVYQDNKEDYANALKIITELKEDMAKKLFKASGCSWTFMNTAGWERNDIVKIPVHQEGYFLDENGQKLNSVKTNEGYEVQLTGLPALGSKQISFITGPENGQKEIPFRAREKRIETPFYHIEWNNEGQLTKIYDKEYQRNVLDESGRGNILQLFEDKPMNFDAWDIDLYYIQKKKELKASSIEMIEVNALYAVIQFTYEFGKSRIVQYMKVYRDNRRIDFETKVDWHERQQLLKAAFEVDVRATQATYDIQFGNVKRPTHWNTSWDMARFESVAHKWVDLSERDYGVSLLNDSKYGHDVKDHTMRITLLKGAIYPDTEADIGEHAFTYSLLPHKGDFVDGWVEQAAWELNNPLLGMQGITSFGHTPFFEIENGEHVVIDAVKKQEDGDGLIVRIHEFTGSKTKVKLRPTFAFHQWVETDLLENIIDGKVAQQSDAAELSFKPYEIKTILFH